MTARHAGPSVVEVATLRTGHRLLWVRTHGRRHRLTLAPPPKENP